ncbi:MAG: hypothetical protein V3T14_00945 [Myxococcota bacterium]
MPTGWRQLILAVGVGLLGVLALPLRIEVGGSHRVELGGGVTLEVDRVTVGLLPIHHLALLQVGARVPLPGGRAVDLQAAEVKVRGVGAGIFGGEPGGDFEEFLATGLVGSFGLLRIVDGELEAKRSSRVLQVWGWGEGSKGGRIDLQGQLGARAPHLGTLRLYLDNVRIAPRSSSEPLDLSGTIVYERLSQENDRVRVALDVRGPAERLRARVEGSVERLGGQFRPGSSLRVQGFVRDFGRSGIDHALHGPFSGSAAVRGSIESLELQLEVDLSELRILIGDQLDKAPGVKTRVELTLKARHDEAPRASARVRLGSMRATASGLYSGGSGRWILQTGWCPVGELIEHVPLLRSPGVAGTGFVRAKMRWHDGDRPSLNLEVANLAVPLGRGTLQVSHADLRFDGETLALEPTTLSLAGEELSVQGSVVSRGEGWDVEVQGRAAHLQIEPVAALFGPTLPDTRAADFETLATEAVGWLRRRSFALRDLRVRPLLLEIGRFQGFGLSERDLRLEARFEDRVIRVRYETAGGAEPQTLCLDLKRFVPRVSISETDTFECSSGLVPHGG